MEERLKRSELGVNTFELILLGLLLTWNHIGYII